jgi:hypothetical protein
MDHSRLESVARALESLNVAELLAHYASGFQFVDVAAGLTITDREELRRYYEALFSMPEVGFGEVAMFEDGRGNGAGEWVWSGLGPDGDRFRVKGCSIFTLDGTGIVREAIYYKPPTARADPMS